jgi:ubiquinone/menaquinone biosynthesis C-methylase UbiE
MDNLPFKKEEFDLIWSEGAIYNIGFQEGLNYWKNFLKKGGYIAVSEVSWFTEKRPEEIDIFWKNNYPQIDTIGNKVKQMEKTGFIPVATFILPENCWVENYYKPQIIVQEKFLEKYVDDKVVESFIANERREADLYNKYKQFYGYVFYIAKKI